MKMILTSSVFICLVLLLSCGKHGKTNKSAYIALPDSIINAPYVNTLVKDLDSGLIGTHVLVRGRITNVIHNNKRCILSNSESSIRLDATGKGEIVGFNRELIGTELTVYGTLRERRFYKEELLRLRKTYSDFIEAAKADTSLTNECDKAISDLNDINSMYKWTLDNNLPYYSILSIDSEDYSILN